MHAASTRTPRQAGARAANAIASKRDARLLHACAIVASLVCLPTASADAPPFDRPGIGFASAVLPAGSFDWEQGLPDMQRDSSSGDHATTWTADTLFRFGLTSTLELQLSGSPWNRSRFSNAGMNSHAQGAGDAAIGLKWAPALASKDWSLALLGVVSLPTGVAAFTAGHTVASLGAAATRDLGANRSLEFYANLDHGAGQNTWTLAVNYGFPIHGGLGGYVETAHSAGGGPASSLLGAGLAWLLHDRVQLDLYADAGLTRSSPDYLAGLGVSVFFGK